MRVNVEHALPRSEPERQGIASSVILRLAEAFDSQIHELHSFMVLRHGYVIAEGWWSPYRPEYRHLLFSVSKSFTSTAVGFAVAEGRLSLDDLVLPFFPEARPPESNDFLAAMSVRHLLTMTTGHIDDTWPYQVMRSDGDWIKAFFEVPVVHPPGTYFLYNTGATHILAAIVQKITGMKLIDYLQPRLFDPLGIQNATWQESPQGVAVGGYGLSLTTEDLARFGQLYLQKGRWGEHQILPAAWVEAATSAQVSNGDSSTPNDWAQGYGYQFWRCRHGAYQASGVFGQGCIVMPQQDAVFCFTGGHDVSETHQLLDIVWEILLPAFELEPPAEDAVIQNALAEKLSALRLATVQNSVASSASSILSPSTRRTYEVDANALNIETIAFDFTPSGSVVTFRASGRETTLDSGYGEWRQGQADLFHGYWLSDNPTPVVASGGWASEDCFMMVVRLIATPFFYTFAFHFVDDFADDEMLVEIRVNVTLETLKPLLLTARLSAA